MTREDIENFTRQAGGFDATPEFLERFAALVAAAEREAALEKNNLTWVANCQHLVAAEREACADVCEGHYDTAQAARAIRARGEKP
jgi:hypothetical protein